MTITKSTLLIVIALSAQVLTQSPQAQQIDPLAIRGIPGTSTLLHQDQTRAYYHISVRGSGVIYAFHNVARDEDVVEHTIVDVPENYSPREYWMAFTISKSEQDYFNKYILKPFLKLSPDKTYVWVQHYNANVLLGRTPFFQEHWGENYEEPLIYTTYRAPKKWLRGDQAGGWELYHGDHLNSTTIGVRYNSQSSFSVEDALAYRTIRSDNLQLAQQESIALQAQLKIADIANRKRLIDEEIARRNEGIVYKSDHFWDPIPYHETIRHVFEGKFSSIKNRYDFMKAFTGYVAMYSGRCNAYLPDKRVRRSWDTQTVTRDLAGREMNRGAREVHNIDIDPLFYPHYDSYLKAMKSHQLTDAFGMATDMIIAMSKPGADPFAIAGNKVTEVIQQDSFYKLGIFFSSTDCASATTKQLNENMYRAAAKQPSLQQAGIHIANAEAESDSPEKFLFEKTFAQACNQYFIELRNTGAERFCRCLDGETRSVLTQQERQKYTDQFGAYFAEIDRAYKQPNDPRWRLQKPLDNCKR